MHTDAVSIATPEAAARVATIHALGFEADPVLSWALAAPRTREKLDAMFSFVVREALVPLGATYLCGDSCAAWTPPDTPEWPDERGRRFGEAISAVCTPEDLERLRILNEVMGEHHPEERHWYLGSIATAPAAQGQGLGSRVLQASLARVDEDRLPAYLEATTARNTALYERHGFRKVGVLELPDGPSMTAMWRDAR